MTLLGLRKPKPAAIFWLFACLLAGWLAGVGTATAQGVDDFTINKFQVSYQIFDDVPGGRMAVSETIDLEFRGNNRGILRAIPSKYKGRPLGLQVLRVERDGVSEPYSLYGDSGNDVIRIGNPDVTITGEHTYRIDYELRNVITFYEEYDEWYWDINGTEWGQQFLSVEGTVVFPPSWTPVVDKPTTCFTGVFGADGQDCLVSETDGGYLFATNRTLLPGETLTLLAALPKGIIAEPTLRDWIKDQWLQLSGLALALIGVGAVVKTWLKWGRPQRRGVIIPEYAPPKNISPMEAGLLMDFRVDSRDVTAMLINLAVRGYIVIHQQSSKRFGLFKQESFEFELKRTDTAELSEEESKLLKAMFTNYTEGSKVAASALPKQNISSVVAQIKASKRKKLSREYGMIDENSRQKVAVVAGAFGFFVLAIFVGGWGWILGAILLAVSAGLTATHMHNRSHAGNEMYEYLLGMKMYMEVAEKDRLAMLQSVDRPYAEPKKTVDLFEKLLPYAIAFGVEKSWAEQFSGLFDDWPEWYESSRAFTPALLSSQLGQVNTSVASFASPQSSSGSGFSSGGSSGGGGGGGGGGGW
jgi:uncharacterized membrane protein YgcG